MLIGKTLRDAIISGANNIANHRSQVDALNVFPVPDGDTGTNMSMTINAARRELEKMPDNATVAEVSATTASALLRGARGNSGVILSLLFRGFSKGLSNKVTATASDIANALTMGVEAAYSAVMKPTEGTILTVSRMAASSARDASASMGNDIESMWTALLTGASETLAKTPDMLPVLKKAGVVDAGGKGLLVVFEGMYSVITGGSIIKALEKGEESQAVKIDLGEFTTEEKFGYCTEFIVEKHNRDVGHLALQAFLDSIGDSLVVVDDDDIIKVHVHTDNPGKALEEALKYGRLCRMKIENMQEQFEALHGGGAKYTGITEAEKSDVLDYVPVDNNSAEYGFVSVAAGEGIHALFGDLGVDRIVSGGQTMNPSTEDILKAVHSIAAKTVFVLPNNKNIIMAAEQVTPLADRRVIVLHTKTVPQGLCAMLAFDENQQPEQNAINMNGVLDNVSTGHITFAARDSDFDGHKIKKDEILAMDNGKLAFTEKDFTTAAVKLCKLLVKKHKDPGFVTVIYGEDVSEEHANALSEQLTERLGDDLEVIMINGGQPVYYFTISVE